MPHGQTQSLNPPESGASFLPPEAALVSGRLREVHLRPGLSMYASDICDLQDLDVSLPLPPGLLLVMALSGQADVSYGAKRFQLGPQRGRDDDLQHEGLALTLTEPEAFVRRLRTGSRRRVISLALGPQWLDESQEALGAPPRLTAFRSTHLAAQRWQLSPRLLAMAGDLLETPGSPSPLQGLYLESRCLEMAAEALTAITGGETAPSTGLRPREQRRLTALCDFLDSGEADELSLQALAERIGMSSSALQRNFRRHTGLSVFDYQRRRRLANARVALERDGISVGEAAHLAGYTSQANFATAFRRQFGLQPGRLRKRG
ncbi:AraC family transcriptional regulator [Nevskia sp.]|uniref:helix-turn-helix transcriptional regulator n=1 Tax=Nevskia sp. TaxID=1929292 RepID=UPI0025D7783B|nr:AraC family transcriptional regulator [Nevskia sp.]